MELEEFTRKSLEELEEKFRAQAKKIADLELELGAVRQGNERAGGTHVGHRRDHGLEDHPATLDSEHSVAPGFAPYLLWNWNAHAAARLNEARKLVFGAGFTITDADLGPGFGTYTVNLSGGAGASGGTVLFDAIVDALYAGADGASEVLASGSTTYLFSTIQAAVTAWVDGDFSTANGSLSLRVNRGAYGEAVVIPDSVPGDLAIFGEPGVRGTSMPVSLDSITVNNYTTRLRLENLYLSSDGLVADNDCDTHGMRVEAYHCVFDQIQGALTDSFLEDVQILTSWVLNAGQGTSDNELTTLNDCYIGGLFGTSDDVDHEIAGVYQFVDTTIVSGIAGNTTGLQVVTDKAFVFVNVWLTGDESFECDGGTVTLEYLGCHGAEVEITDGGAGGTVNVRYVGRVPNFDVAGIGAVVLNKFPGTLHEVTEPDAHTAGNWKVLYSNGSGQIVELALGAAGTVLTSGGAAVAPTFAAGGGGGGHTLKDQGNTLATRANMDFYGDFIEARDDAASTASKIRAGYSLYDAIVDSNQHESLEANTATSVTTTTLTRTGAGWTAGQWIGRRVIITNGGLVGTGRVVTANTTDTLTFATITGLSGTPTYMIQNGTPVYRRLIEAVRSGHTSILYREASGESAFTISSTDPVMYILGDNSYDASISVDLTIQKSQLVFDQLSVTSHLNFDATGCVALGVNFNSGGRVTLAQQACTVIACRFVGAGSGASPPVTITSSLASRVQASSFSNSSANDQIVASGSASNYTIVGNLFFALTGTGYAINVPVGAAGISGNFVEVSTSATGGVNSGTGANLSGNLVSILGRTSGTAIGFSVANRAVISANTFTTGAFNTTGVCKMIVGQSAVNGLLITGNLFIAQGNAVSTGYSVKCIEWSGGASFNVITNNIFMQTLGAQGATWIAVDPGGTAGADLLFLGNVLVGSAGGNAPGPWVPVKNVQVLTRAVGNMPGAMPDAVFENYNYLGEQDWGDDAIPPDWEAFGTGGAQTYGAGAVIGGELTINTGAVSGNDSGLRYNQDVAGGAASLLEIHFDFDLSSVASVRFRIGLGNYGAWVTNMARPTDGLFLELDTAVDANFHLVMKVAGTTQNVGLGAATTGKHRIDAWVGRAGHLWYNFDGTVVYTNSASGFPSNLMCPGLFIRALAAADKIADNDFIKWGCKRA